MHTDSFDLLTVHYNSDLSGLLLVTAPDASVYVDRPRPPTEQEKDDFMIGTFPPDVLCASLVLPWSRVQALAQMDGTENEVMTVDGPDRSRTDDHDAKAYWAALENGQVPPPDVPRVHLLVRRGALRRFVADRRIALVCTRMEHWQDVSTGGLDALAHLLVLANGGTGHARPA